MKRVKRAARLVLAVVVVAVHVPVNLLAGLFGWLLRGKGEDRYERRKPRWSDD